MLPAQKRKLKQRVNQTIRNCTRQPLQSIENTTGNDRMPPTDISRAVGGPPPLRPIGHLTESIGSSATCASHVNFNEPDRPPPLRPIGNLTGSVKELRPNVSHTVPIVSNVTFPAKRIASMSGKIDKSTKSAAKAVYHMVDEEFKTATGVDFKTALCSVSDLQIQPKKSRKEIRRDKENIQREMKTCIQNHWATVDTNIIQSERISFK